MPHVLVVDDERIFRTTLQALLKRHDFDVAVAGNSDDALAAATTRQPDVLVVDWMLGSRLDGLELADAVRALNPALGTVVITGFPAPDLQRRVERMPSTRFLTKPFEFVDLVLAIRAVSHTGG